MEKHPIKVKNKNYLTCLNTNERICGGLICIPKD